MTPTRLEAIENFLNASTHPELARLFNRNMEVQVNVAQDGGDRVQGDYNGKQWLAWTDSYTTWKSFRIPFKANTEPEYTDKPITYDLAAHVEGIGMTGWDWVNRQSRWLAYDFDAITGHSDKHSKKLTDAELMEVRTTLERIPWVQLRYSTSGKGLHVYVHLSDEASGDLSIKTNNHHEHAALGRAMLNTLCALCAYDFNTKVDVSGGNMWVWHRKMLGTDGLKLIKDNRTKLELRDIPQNWREHLKVVRGQGKKVGLNNLTDKTDSDFESTFESLTTQQSYVKLDAEHRRLVDYLQKHGAMWWWDSDHNMMICHTYDLKMAKLALGLKGVFDTLATGSEAGSDINCYCCPLPKGAWVVRRYGRGTQESASWTQDGTSWTKCVLNRDVEFDVAMRLNNGVELEKGGYHFDTVKLAIEALKLLGCTVDVHHTMVEREAVIKEHKEEGKINLSVQYNKTDKKDLMPGFVVDKHFWKKVCSITVPLKLSGDNDVRYDDIVRHLVSPANTDCGWVIKGEGGWIDEPLTHVRACLSALEYSSKENVEIIGDNVFKPWRLVNLPFQPEYTGDRVWNRDGAQLRFAPAPEPGDYPTWKSVLEHCGQGLDEAVQNHPWCKANGIILGSEYLKCWIASLIKEPLQPLPYLFFFSEEQDTGKSTFHESLALLFTKGVVNANQALTSQGGFNAEIENAILCTIEELDLSKVRNALSRMKEWVTAIQLSVHPKGGTPYMTPNTTHWCQFANSRSHVPVFPGDSRVTMIRVSPFKEDEPKIAKRDLQRMLEKEAPDFLRAIMDLELPVNNDRLNLPVLETSEKLEVANQNMSEVEAFFDKETYPVAGSVILYSDCYERFKEWLPADRVAHFSKQRFSKELPPKLLKGRLTTNLNIHFGNISFSPDTPPGQLLVKVGDFLK